MMALTMHCNLRPPDVESVVLDFNYEARVPAYKFNNSAISQLPKSCVKISILMYSCRCMWVRSFSTRLTSVTFAEDKGAHFSYSP